MNASGSRSARMATYSAVQGPMPGKATSERRSSTRVGARVDDDVTDLDGLGQGHAARCRRPAGMANAPGSCGREFDERRRRREQVGQPAVGCGQRVAGRVHQPPGHGAGARHRDLLADHGAHGQLEAVGRARARADLDRARTSRSDERVRAEGLPHGDGVGVEVEELAAARHRSGQVAQVGEDQLSLHVGRAAPLVLRRVGHLGGAAASRRRGRGAGAGSGGRTSPSSSSTPGSARAPRKSSTDAGLNGRRQGRRRRIACASRLRCRPASRCHLACPEAEAAGSVGKDLADGVVALAHAGEAGGEGDVRDREVGGLEEHACRLAALRPGQGERSRAHLGA